MILCKETWAKAIDSAVFPGIQGGPLMHVIAGKAVAFGEALQPNFKVYQQQVLDNAKTLAEELMAAGFPIVSGGTDNHLMLVDVFSKSGIGGKQAEADLDAAGITVNKNMIPYDPRKPMDPSGIRIGTPALTTRGMKQAEMKRIAKWITEVLSRPADAELLSRVRGSVHELCESFPVPEDQG
jgi:glycine hydroxymethyltransferase